MVERYTPDLIRNLAVTGHLGSGKTSLVEALLAHTGTITERGRVEAGTTVADFDPLEHRYRHSLHASLVGLDYAGRRIHLLDTPGEPELIGRAVQVLPAVEAMLLVIHAVAGIEPVTRQMRAIARDHGLPLLVVINHIDAENRDLAATLAAIQEEFGRECLPLNLPADQGAQVVDCYTGTHGMSDLGPVETAHTALMDQVIEVNEALIGRYLEGAEVSEAELHDTFEQALREGHLTPVCFTSAETGAGLPELLEICARLAPNPAEGAPHAFLKGSGARAQSLLARPQTEQPVLAHVFKVDHDPFVGTMGTMRVHQGVIRKGMELLIDEGGERFKVGHLFRLHGKEHRELPKAIPGDICTIAKVEALHNDTILHGSHEADDVHAAPWVTPEPTAGVAIAASAPGDEAKISDVLQKLVSEDPSLRLEHDMHSNETVLRGQGETHLKVVLEELDDRFHVRVMTHPPSIPYRETVGGTGRARVRHKKQTGGAGQFAEVELTVEPLERGRGFEFADAVTGGAIPNALIPAVEKGVRQVLEIGAIAGYTMQDLKVTVVDGKYHPVDSKEIAFVIAGRKAFLEAVQQADPQVLEPQVRIQVTVPDSLMGPITADLSGRRGRIVQTEGDGSGQMRVAAYVPLAELETYATRLKSLTGGQGQYTLEFSHYEPAPDPLQAELTRDYVVRLEE